MKYFIALIVGILFIIGFAVIECNADQFTFAWDYDDGTVVEGFRLFSGNMGQNADGTWGGQYGDTPLIDNIAPDLREITAIQNGWAGASKKFCFVLRAFKGDKVSENSNEVCATINNTALQRPQNVLGSWDHDNSVVVIQWNQPDLDRAKYWQIFYKFTDESEYRLLGRLDKAGNPDLVLEKEISDVPAGEARECVFVVVAYKDSEVYSPDSEEIPVTIDRSGDETTIPAPNNFRISVTIGVK